MSNKKNIILSFVVILLLVVIAAAVYQYKHNCQQQMREVDRYALPLVVEFMKVLETWDYENIKPYLTKGYQNSLTLEEWQSEFETLSVLGELESFARPNFVSHQAYKKYYVCESAIDIYSVASEYENANAVVRVFFDNDCGKLKIRTFLVTSKIIQKKPDFMQGVENEAVNSEINDLIESDDESISDDYDMDAEFEQQQEESMQEQINEIDQNIEKAKSTNIYNEEVKGNKPKGKIYRY